MQIRQLTAIVVTITGLLGFSHAHAQSTTNTPPPNFRNREELGADERLNKLAEDLKLSNDQKAKIQATFDEMRTKIQSAIIEARTNAESQLRKTLSPEQYEKLENMLGHPSGPTESRPSDHGTNGTRSQSS